MPLTAAFALPAVAELQPLLLGAERPLAGHAGKRGAGPRRANEKGGREARDAAGQWEGGEGGGVGANGRGERLKGGGRRREEPIGGEITTDEGRDELEGANGRGEYHTGGRDEREKTNGKRDRSGGRRDERSKANGRRDHLTGGRDELEGANGKGEHLDRSGSQWEED